VQIPITGFSGRRATLSGRRTTLSGRRATLSGRRATPSGRHSFSSVPIAPASLHVRPGVTQGELCSIQPASKPKRLRREEGRAQGKEQHGRAWNEGKYNADRYQRNRDSGVRDMHPGRMVLLRDMKFFEAFARREVLQLAPAGFHVADHCFKH
jgi:hypothetical protein